MWIGLAVAPALTQQTTTPAPVGKRAVSAPASSKLAAPIHIPLTPKEFFARAQQLTDLEAAGIPFHLKATFVASGHTEFTGNGTYEIWWRSKNLWQVDATLKDYRLVKIEQGGKLKVYSSSSYVPLRLRQAVDGVLLHPAAHKAGDACARSCGAKWKRGHQKINGLDFTKLTSEYICAGGIRNPTLCTLQYYFTPDGIPRIFANGSIDILYNDFQSFQKVEVPRSVTVASGGNIWLDISIRSVEALPPSQKIPLEDEAVKKLQQHCAFGSCRIDMKKAVFVPPKLLSRSPVRYPYGAKLRLKQGKVVVRLTIDTHGKAREPYVLASAGPLLDRAALNSVRRYKYRPERVNGRPVPVRTMMVVDFALPH